MNDHHTDLHALVGAYALDALDGAEADAFTRHLDECEACRREVAEFRATTARLASAVAEEPPAALKQRTLDALDGVRQLPPRLNSAHVTRSLAERLRRKALLLGLAASLVAAASFAGLAVWQHQEVRQAQEQTQRAQQNLETISGILAAPDSRTVHGRAANGALTTVVTSTRQNKAVFTATGLPEPAAGRTYQLWLQHGGTMRPAGLIHQDGTVLVDGDPADATALGLTLEPSGGSPQPTTAPLLLMNMPA
ncbi:anti-sigma factor domain-containing protein [Streptomyces sp. NPDC057854]|uniref:anti-sigma factor n=1 Tax=unclassified Streptomyces TaxID=2593676 RepID=UPI00367D26C6